MFHWFGTYFYQKNRGVTQFWPYYSFERFTENVLTCCGNVTVIEEVLALVCKSQFVGLFSSKISLPLLLMINLPVSDVSIEYPRLSPEIKTLCLSIPNSQGFEIIQFTVSLLSYVTVLQVNAAIKITNMTIIWTSLPFVSFCAAIIIFTPCNKVQSF